METWSYRQDLTGAGKTFLSDVTTSLEEMSLFVTVGVFVLKQTANTKFQLVSAGLWVEFYSKYYFHFEMGAAKGKPPIF